MKTLDRQFVCDCGTTIADRWEGENLPKRTCPPGWAEMSVDYDSFSSPGAGRSFAVIGCMACLGTRLKKLVEDEKRRPWQIRFVYP